MKKILFVLSLGISLVIITRLAMSIYTLWHKQDVLISSENQLKQEKTENTSLQHQLGMVNSPSFVEEEARNKLFMIKPGEGEVMISQDIIAAKKGQKASVMQLPYWQQWVKLFFH